MRELANDTLSVTLLDPDSDASRLGPRFCWGGYVWQVSDCRLGPLLAGPEWPHPTPSAFNGQGLPESFRHSTMSGQTLLWEGTLGLAPGAGALTRNAKGEIEVTAPCAWRTSFGKAWANYETAQQVGGWSYALARRIELRDRSLLSCTTLSNKASTPFRLEWFAHPFFALNAEGKAVLTLPRGTRLDENPGYFLEGNQLRFRRAFAGQFDGLLVQPRLPSDQPFALEVDHPLLSGLRFSGDIAPFQNVLWANGNTVSLEPYLALNLAPGASRSWTLRYDFGAARS